MEKARNGAFLIFVVTLLMAAGLRMSAQALDCDPIGGGQIWDECETDLYSSNCVAYPQEDPAQEWCAEHEEDTCADFCQGAGNVTGSSCQQTESSSWCGMHTWRANGLYIWCACTEVK